MSWWGKQQDKWLDAILKDFGKNDSLLTDDYIVGGSGVGFYPVAMSGTIPSYFTTYKIDPPLPQSARAKEREVKADLPEVTARMNIHRRRKED